MSHSDFVGITDNGALCDANGHVVLSLAHNKAREKGRRSNAIKW